MMGASAVSAIEADYRRRFPGSLRLYERACQLMPSGVNHDVRRLLPCPVYIDRADGCRKWDVDGNEFVDYALGHGALMLGHGHPDVMRAIHDQVTRATHTSAPTPHEVRWAEIVTSLVPGAERVRFVLSGTEATMLAMRIARAHTGRPNIVKIEGHFHGWHDYAMVAHLPPFDIPSSNGVPKAVLGTMRAVPVDDLDMMERALKAGDVAAVILEPDGPAAGQVPIRPAYLKGLRELTRRYGVILIFDEVITGFRLAPGGAQQYFGVTADLCTFAKAVAGGMPSGAVAGRAELLDNIAFRDDADWNRRGRVRHQGTFSAFPVAAAAGVAALELLADGSAQDHAALMADRLRAGFNAAMDDLGVSGCAYGTRSIVRLALGDDLPRTHAPAEFAAQVPFERLLEGAPPSLIGALRRALLLEGIDILGGIHGFTSAVHRESDIDSSVDGFRRALTRLISDGWIEGRAG